MKKLLLLIMVASFLSFGVNAQSMGRSYKTALGIKVWDGGGISLKTFVAPKNALEVIGYFNGDGTRLTALYEIHGNLSGAPGLKWYIGPGAHVGIYRGYPHDGFAGIDGVLGLDYKVNNVPLNFSIDWQPSYEFDNGGGFVGSWVGLGIRYAF